MGYGHTANAPLSTVSCIAAHCSTNALYSYSCSKYTVAQYHMHSLAVSFTSVCLAVVGLLLLVSMHTAHRDAQQQQQQQQRREAHAAFTASLEKVVSAHRGAGGSKKGGGAWGGGGAALWEVFWQCARAQPIVTPSSSSSSGGRLMQQFQLVWRKFSAPKGG